MDPRPGPVCFTGPGRDDRRHTGPLPPVVRYEASTPEAVRAVITAAHRVAGPRLDTASMQPRYGLGMMGPGMMSGAAQR